MTVDDLMDLKPFEAAAWIDEAHRDQLLDVLRANLEAEAEAFDRKSLEAEYVETHMTGGAAGYDDMGIEDLQSEVRRLLREAQE